MSVAIGKARECFQNISDYDLCFYKWSDGGACVLGGFDAVWGLSLTLEVNFNFRITFSNTKSHSIFHRVSFGKFFFSELFSPLILRFRKCKQRQLTMGSKGYFLFKMNNSLHKYFIALMGLNDAKKIPEGRSWGICVRPK